MKEIHAELLRKHLNRFQRIQEEEEEEEEEEGDKKEPQTLHKEESPEHVAKSPEQDAGMCFRIVSYAF